MLYGTTEAGGSKQCGQGCGTLAPCYARPMGHLAEIAFLSVRLPETTRNRLKTVASARGQTVQSLVGGLVERFLVEEARTPPALGTAVATLRAHAEKLRQRAITALWVFGSVARGVSVRAGPCSGAGRIRGFW